MQGRAPTAATAAHAFRQSSRPAARVGDGTWLAMVAVVGMVMVVVAMVMAVVMIMPIAVMVPVIVPLICA